MCVIVTKPKGAEIDLDVLHDCWRANKHGAGIAYVLNERVNLIKGLMEWEQFKNVLGDAKKWTDIPAMFHFRIRTHGETNEANTHPFSVIPGKLVFSHNGVMHGMAKNSRPELSDTACFNRYVLKQLPHNFLNNQGIVDLICHTIGRNNKLAFLDSEGNITIFNEDLGYKNDEGVWFSNDNHIPRRYAYAGGYSANWRSQRSGQPWKPTPSPSKGSSYGTGARYPESITPSQVLGETGHPVTETDDALEGARAAGYDKKEIVFGSLAEADWYCADCAVWFEEDELLQEDWGDPTPLCPSCLNNQHVTWGFDEVDTQTENSATGAN